MDKPTYLPFSVLGVKSNYKPADIEVVSPIRTGKYEQEQVFPFIVKLLLEYGPDEFVGITQEHIIERFYKAYPEKAVPGSTLVTIALNEEWHVYEDIKWITHDGVEYIVLTDTCLWMFRKHRE